MYPVLKLEDIMEKYSIVFAVYFGSYQTKYYNSESDIDIAFLSKRILSADEKLDLLKDLIIFHKKSEIDLVDLRTAEPLLKNEIGRTGRILYESEPGIFERYALFYIKNFYELKDSIDYEMKKIKNAIREFVKNG